MKGGGRAKHRSRPTLAAQSRGTTTQRYGVCGSLTRRPTVLANAGRLVSQLGSRKQFLLLKQVAHEFAWVAPRRIGKRTHVARSEAGDKALWATFGRRICCLYR